ncbi:MAG: amidohydrolase [Sphingobacteriales bacterium]|nr:amidohydrolase [Sphingobacteriales bacterium]
MNLKRISLIAVTILAFAACKNATQTTTATNDSTKATMYFGGDIITMEGDSANYAESVVVKDGKIIFVGNKDEAMKAAGDGHNMIDLQGKTMLPGFIDAHGHMVYYGKNLMDQSLTGVKDISEIIQRMKSHIAQIPGDGWIVGMGYAPLKMKEQRHPTADELDQISMDRPVLVVHASGHGGSMNHALMKLLHIDEKTVDPNGGEYVREKGSKMPAGPMEETALIDVRNQRPAFTGEAADKVIKEASKIWASNGQTTAMECGLGLGADDISIVENAIEKKILPIDLVVFSKESATDDVVNTAYGIGEAYSSKSTGSASKLLSDRVDLDKRYINRVRLGGIKLWLDGNPVLAWMSEAYATPPPGREPGFKGYGQIPDSVIFSFFDKYWKTNMQINMHVNGDEAIEQALRATEAAIKKHGMSDHRPVFVHCSYARPDQIARMKAVGAIPSFLSFGLYGQGDEVEIIWGTKRASNGMAAQSMLKAGVPFTLSHDAPITPPMIMPQIWAAVNRVTSSGKVLGADQRVSPYQALQAVTSAAAYQIKEEKSKGTIQAGKLADLVILDKNPLKVDPMTFKDIQVMETIKEGNSIFKLSSTVAYTPVTISDHNHETGHQKPLSVSQQKLMARLVQSAK